MSDTPPRISKERFLNRHKHEILGMILEAMRSDWDLRKQSMFVELCVRKVEAKLTAIYDDKLLPEPETPPPPPPATGNGTPTAGKPTSQRK